MGNTPVNLNLNKNDTYIIEFRKEGYKPIVKTINSKVGAGWIVLDVLGGLIPVIVDAATGAWMELDQKAVNAALIQDKS
ncbi:hypothetical protein ES702_04427 [subsurface metagenome]